jgi:hypothetical protein
MRAARLIGLALGALLLNAAHASAQPFDDEGFGWGPYYNNHLSPWDGRPVGPPLAALPPGSEYYNGRPRVGYPVTAGPLHGPERAYRYPSYGQGYAAPPRHAVRKQRAVKRRTAGRR